MQVREPSARVEHEASTSKIGEDQLFYFQQRGVDVDDAVGMIISGFCREVFNELPLGGCCAVRRGGTAQAAGSCVPWRTSAGLTWNLGTPLCSTHPLPGPRLLPTRTSHPPHQHYRSLPWSPWCVLRVLALCPLLSLLVPAEFAQEVNQLMSLKLENSVG